MPHLGPRVLVSGVGGGRAVQSRLKSPLATRGNPVKEKLVEHPRDWPWSSWSFYETGEGLLKIDALQGKARRGKE